MPETCCMNVNHDLDVLVLAPTGRDASLLVGLLQRTGIEARSIETDQAVPLVEDQRGGLFLIAEEALSTVFIASLGQALERQPSWADFPLIILTSHGGETAHSRRLEQERLPLPTHTLLERPIRPNTFITSVRAALRARRRQYEVRQGIQELREASAALALSEERNRLILQSTRDCIKLLDLEANLLSINAEGQERLGIDDLDAVLKRCWLTFWAPQYRGLAEEAVASALEGGAGRFEGEFLRADGDRSWWDVSVTPVRDESSVITNLLVVSREVTSRKRAEKALIESEKLAAVGRLAASISHEINNPLEAVTNLLFIVGNDSSLSTQGQAYLALADRELARVSQIAGQTLRFHRQATRPRSLTPKELIEPVLALYQGRLVNSRISIELQIRDQQEVTCYEGDIRQVLNNLVGNAIDAMRSGGRLVIRAQRSRHWVHGSTGARITIADTGHGMPKQVAAHIFEAFYTTKGINGNGLGLWISHGIVQKHRGHLRVRSRAAEGQPGLTNGSGNGHGVANGSGTGTANGTGNGYGNGSGSSYANDSTVNMSSRRATGTVFSLFLPTQLAEVAS
jgi:PAS domain S-box-containing protein